MKFTTKKLNEDGSEKIIADVNIKEDMNFSQNLYPNNTTPHIDAISVSNVLEEIDNNSTKTSISKSSQSLTKEEIARNLLNRVNQKGKPVVSQKMRRTSFQARLGSKMDKIARKLIDNQIRLTSNPTNMLRIKVNRDERSQDLISRTISDAEIVPIILPPMTDIPMRKFIKRGAKEVLIPSLYPTAETTYYELYSPLEVKMDEDDLLLRIIQDPHSDEPYVLCLQITDILGTLGYSSFRHQKFWATIYDEKLPDDIIKLISAAKNQRELLGW